MHHLLHDNTKKKKKKALNQRKCAAEEGWEKQQQATLADTSMLGVPHTRTALGDRSFAVAGLRIWNSLPPSIRDLTLSAGTFATPLKTYLFV